MPIHMNACTCTHHIQNATHPKKIWSRNRFRSEASTEKVYFTSTQLNWMKIWRERRTTKAAITDRWSFSEWSSSWLDGQHKNSKQLEKQTYWTKSAMLGHRFGCPSCAPCHDARWAPGPHACWLVWWTPGASQCSRWSLQKNGSLWQKNGLL